MIRPFEHVKGDWEKALPKRQRDEGQVRLTSRFGYSDARTFFRLSV
jgi:hypothetical protein